MAEYVESYPEQCAFFLDNNWQDRQLLIRIGRASSESPYAIAFDESLIYGILVPLPNDAGELPLQQALSQAVNAGAGASTLALYNGITVPLSEAVTLPAAVSFSLFGPDVAQPPFGLRLVITCPHNPNLRWAITLDEQNLHLHSHQSSTNTLTMLFQVAS